MKKLIGVILGIVVLAAAGFVGAAYWSGQRAERWYKEALAEAKNPNVKFDTVKYERGVFSSQVETRVQFVLPEGGAPGGPDPSFSIRQDIYHGPLPLAGRGVAGVPMQWGSAVVRATLVKNSGWVQELAKLYGNQEPIEAISTVGFDGASSTRVAMPPLTLSDIEDLQSLKFAGLQGQFQVAPKGATVQGSMSVSSLEAVGKPAPNSVQISMRDLTVTANQHKGAFNLMLGDSSFKIGELRVQDQTTGTPVVVTNLSVNATGSLNPQNPQQVAGEVLFKTDKVTVAQQSGTGDLKLAMRNLDGATVEKLQQWQQKLAGNPNDPQALDELLKLVKTLLQGKPEFALETQGKLNQDEWQAKLVLNFQDFGDINLLQDPAGLLGALEKGMAEVKASKALVEIIVADMIKEQLPATQGEQPNAQSRQNMAAAQANEQLQGLISAGFIQMEGNQYKTKARFEGGKLFVNDKEIPLAAMAGGDGGMSEDEMPLEPDGGAEDDAEESPQQ